LLTATDSRSAFIWDWKNWQEVGNLTNAVVYAFSRDGRMVAGKEFDGRHDFRVWEIAANKEVAILSDTAHVNGEAAFSPDGRRIALPQENGNIQVWTIFATAQDLVDRAKRALLTCLTPQQRKDAFLGPEPPQWCITGAGLENEPDPTKWQPKWPYKSEEWRRWLLGNRHGRT
jgi:WD40 repeat protein